MTILVEYKKREKMKKERGRKGTEIGLLVKIYNEERLKRKRRKGINL